MLPLRKLPFLIATGIWAADIASGFAPNHLHSSTERSTSSSSQATISRPPTALSDTTSSSSSSSSLSRRQLGELAIAATGLAVTAVGTAEPKPTDYGLWGVLPVGPYKTKRTIRETIVPNQLWTLDQKFGILNVQVPLRMTIMKLSSGGLLVYNPIAATQECLSLVNDIAREHGPVMHILVGSVALEHKVYAGVFAQKFTDAQVWLTPGQYSFPTNLPDTFLGFPAGRTRMMPRTIEDAPDEWKQDLDISVLGPIISRDGAFAETVVLHKPTQTLVCTDTALQVTEEVPAIYEETDEHEPLLYHARDTVTDVVQDTPATRRKGWRRIVLFGLYFMPSAITIKDAKTALDERRPDIDSDFLGIYPWDWTGDEEASWKALTGERGVLVAPILQVLLLNRSPVEVLDFADKVAKWQIQRIIPAHLKNNIKATAKDYRDAFGFLEANGVPAGLPRPLDADLKTLLDAEGSLIESGAIATAPPKIGGKVSRADIIAQTVYKCRKGVCAPKANP